MNLKTVVAKMKSSKIFKNSSWIIIEKICQMIIALLVNRTIAQYLQPENYGTLDYGASIVAFFFNICKLGLDSIIIKEIVQKPDKQGEIMGTSILLRFISSLLSIISIGIIVIILNPNNTLILTITILQSISLLFESINVIQLWYQAKLKSKYIAIIAFIVYMLVAIFKVILVLLKKQLIWFAFANSLTAILLAIITFSLYKMQGRSKT